MMICTYSCSIPALGHPRTAKEQPLSRSRLQMNFALILSWFQTHGGEYCISVGDPVSLTSIPAIWVQLLCTTTVPLTMASSAWLMKNQIRESLLMVPKGCQSNIPSEEAWNMAHICICVPRLSSRNHKHI